MPDLCTPWFTADDLLCCDAGTPGVTGTVLATQDWIHRATGSRYTGECRTRIRPMRPCGHAAGGCGCRGWDRLDLSTMVPGPVVAVDQIAIAGEVVDAPLYELWNGRYLSPVLPDGRGAAHPLYPWPPQDPNLPDDADGAWYVDVRHGTAPPPSILFATMDLTCELLKRGQSGKKCKIPENAVSVTEAGIVIALQPPKDGKTGIPMIDTILDLVPRGAGRSRRLFDPTEDRSPSRPLTSP